MGNTLCVKNSRKYSFLKSIVFNYQNHENDIEQEKNYDSKKKLYHSSHYEKNFFFIKNKFDCMTSEEKELAFKSKLTHKRVLIF